MREENGVIVSGRLARHRGYSVGDELHVNSPQGEVLSLPVIAISDAYGYFPHPDPRVSLQLGRAQRRAGEIPPDQATSKDGFRRRQARPTLVQ